MLDVLIPACFYCRLPKLIPFKKDFHVCCVLTEKNGKAGSAKFSQCLMFPIFISKITQLQRRSWVGCTVLETPGKSGTIPKNYLSRSNQVEITVFCLLNPGNADALLVAHKKRHIIVKVSNQVCFCQYFFPCIYYDHF